jgi:hypothetical protein
VDVRFHEEVWDVTVTPLVVACERGHMEVARLLLEHGGETQHELEAALCWTAVGGHVEVVKLLLERGARLYSIHIWVAATLKYSCVFCQKVSQLKNSSEVGADPSVRANDAVCLAAANGHVNVVKLLLQDERVSPAAQENNAVFYAAWNGHCDVLEILLADPRIDGTAAIPVASSRAVHVLLEDERCGIHVNRPLFLEQHEKEVARFEELVEERTARICAVSWVMKVIGNGWGDLREPTEERMAKQP